MRHVARKSLITVAAAGGVLAAGGGQAFADSSAQGVAANSSGVISGNTVQAPVETPVNVCGNTTSVVGVLNPAVGNTCVNASDGHSSGGATAEGGSSNSPGVGSGNTVQVPVNAPVNVCGNSVNVGGALNPATGNECVNGSDRHPGKPDHPNHPDHPDQPDTPDQPDNPDEPKSPDEPKAPEEPKTPETPEEKPKAPEDEAEETDEEVVVTQHEGTDELAQTGSDSLALALPISAGLLLGGALLYRRSRARA